MQAILFDLGNVLIPYDHHHTLAVVARLCATETATLRTVHREASRAMGLGQMTPAAYCDLVRICTGAQTVTDAEIATAFCAGLSRNEAALAYAVALQSRPGVAVGIISNTNALHVAWLDAHVPELKKFELVLFSNEVALLKPERAIYRLALELLEVAPEAALFVDDLEENVVAANAAGVAGIVHADWGVTKPAIEAWLQRAGDFVKA